MNKNDIMVEKFNSYKKDKESKEIHLPKVWDSWLLAYDNRKRYGFMHNVEFHKLCRESRQLRIEELEEITDEYLKSSLESILETENRVMVELDRRNNDFKQDSEDSKTLNDESLTDDTYLVKLSESFFHNYSEILSMIDF